MRNFMRACFLLLVLFLLPLRAEIVDRILAAVGERVITWSEALWEARYDALLNGQEPPGKVDPEGLRTVVSHMVVQTLLEQAREQSPFSPPDDPETPRRLGEIRKRFPDSAAYRKALARYGMTERELRARLAREFNILAFVQYRLRPQVRLDPAQVEAYYRNTLLPEWRRRQGLGPQQEPRLSELRGSIEQVLIQREIDRLLEAWLQELRRRTSVRMLPSSGME